MKKSLLALAVCALVGSVFAEGSSYDFSPVTTEITSISTGLKTWVTAALPVLLGVAGAFLVFWLGRLALGVLKGLGRAGR